MNRSVTMLGWTYSQIIMTAGLHKNTTEHDTPAQHRSCTGMADADVHANTAFWTSADADAGI
jgi:hypothetical protein